MLPRSSPAYGAVWPRKHEVSVLPKDTNKPSPHAGGLFASRYSWSMRRIASLLLIAAFLSLPAVAIPTMPVAYAQEPALEAPPEIGPDQRTESERVSEDAEAIEDEAWTFRFLVPAALVISAIAVLATVAVYTFRVKARYRVAK